MRHVRRRPRARQNGFGHAYGLAGIVLVGLLAGCADPGEHYDDFLRRADRSAPDVEQTELVGMLTDITGDYLYNIALKPLGDVYLELRVTFTGYELNEDGDEASVSGEFRFTDETLEDEPLTTFVTLLDSEGRMTIDVGRVRIEADRSPVEDTAVEVDFSLDVVVLEQQRMCGLVSDEESVVFEPLRLQLRGTTFGAERYGPRGELPTMVPTECPQIDGGGDAGSDLDMGLDTDVGGDADGELQPPDVDFGGAGQRSDVTGRFWMKASLSGGALDLDFILDLQYFESEAGASVDGALRSVAADPADPAIEQFSEPVDENGEFTVIIPGLRTDSTLGPVEADIALRGILLDEDALCGEAAGSVTSPLTVNLRGTTFGAVRIPAGSFEEPAEALTGCP